MKDSNLKRTPLYESHVALGARMVPFAGYLMPVEYTGILEEHAIVRTGVGIFDVSHMGEIEIRGRRALDFCQKMTTNDASDLKGGKIQYTTILNEKGGIIDDCTLYRLSDENFLFVVNASRRGRVMEWFRAHPMDHVEVNDRSDDYALFAVQGKKAESFLSKLIKRDLTTIQYYEFVWTEFAGTATLISRTGYTGEDGFEIYIPTSKAKEAWDVILNEGKEVGLKPIGLGARDTLRLEMGYLLYGNDMDEGTTPLEAGLQWIVKMEKGSFMGRERLSEQKEKGVSKRIRGVKMGGRGIPRAHYPIQELGKKVGEVTSGTFSPTLKIGIALAYIDASVPADSTVSVVIRNREEPAMLVKPPFVQGSIKR